MNDATARRPVWKGSDSQALLSLTALRIGLGVVMAAHGWAKLGDVPGWQASVAALGVPAPDLAAWLAIAAELLGGIGLVVGFLTPIAAFGIFATMVTAIVTVHWGNGLLAANDGFELPLTLALIAAFFVARGAGPLSVDARVARLRLPAEVAANRHPPQPRDAQPVPH